MSLTLPERGRLGNIVVSTRAALRGQHFAMLVAETGEKYPWPQARRKFGNLAVGTAERYIRNWGNHVL